MLKKDLTVTLYVGGKPVDTLTDAQREIVSQRMSKAVSMYYTNHSEEYMKLKG